MNAGRARKRSKQVNAASRPIEKACRILKAMTDPQNSRLTDIAAYCGLQKSTAMRTLDVLVREDFVRRDAASKRYVLGPEITRLAARVGEKRDWISIARPTLIRLSGEFGDTAILSVLTGIETVCVDVQKGDYPLQANYQQIGSRRTLGVGSGGIVLLAMLSEAERQAALSQIPPRLSRYPRITRSLLAERITAAEEAGYAVLFDVVVPQMGGIAVGIRDDSGRPVAALSIAALAVRIATREAALASSLKREALVIEKSLSLHKAAAL